MVTFDMDYDTQVTIPSSTGINLPFNLNSPDVETNSSTEFENNNTNADLVENVYLTKLSLTVNSPTSGEFSFLKSIEIWLVADGLEKKKISWRDNIPDNIGKTIELTLTDNDLKEFVKKDKFSIEVKAVTDKFLASNYTIDVKSLFKVSAKVFH